MWYSGKLHRAVSAFIQACNKKYILSNIKLSSFRWLYYKLGNNFVYRLETDFNVGSVLGKGAFAHVYEVKNKVDGGTYALKVVKLPSK